MAIRTLLVEDSVLVRNVLRRRLEEIGCDIVGEAEHATDGLKLFRSLQPNLVTLDLVMPQMDRFDSYGLFRLIRRESPETSVIVISAHPKKTTRSDFLRAGALEYFEKPFIDSRALAAALNRAFPELKVLSRTAAAARL